MVEQEEISQVKRRRQFRWLMDDIDAHLSAWACDQFNTTKVRGDQCKCPTCRSKHDDADDRMLWMHNTYQWHLKRKSEKLPSINNGDTDLQKA